MMTKKVFQETSEILKYASDKIHPALFSKMVLDFAVMFAMDNPKFDAKKFYSACGYHVAEITQ